MAAIGTNYNALNNAILGSISSVYSNAASRLGAAATGRQSGGMQGLYQQPGNNRINTVARVYVANIKSAANEIGDAVKSLTDKSPKNDIYGQRVAVSSDEAAVTASLNSNSRFNTYAPTSIEVEQLATGQQNQGASLNADTKIGASGYYQFELSAGGRSRQVSFEVSASDTTKDMQEKMAQAINSRNMGVKASVVEDKKAGTSRLDIQSLQTGENARFSMRDISGNAVAATAADQVASTGQDAIYRQNGVEKRSESNIVDLENGMTATLRKVTSGPVQVSASTDASGAADEVKNLVRGYNSLLDAANNASGIRGADSLRNQLYGLSKSYSGALNRVGISADRSGKLQIDEKKLSKAADDGSLERLFRDNASSRNGFAGRVGRLADEIDKNPAQFVSGMRFANQSALGLLNTGLIFDFAI